MDGHGVSPFGITLHMTFRGGSRFKVQGSRFKVQGSGFRVQGSGFKVQGSRFEVLTGTIMSLMPCSD
jgi:hypothetical protein